MTGAPRSPERGRGRSRTTAHLIIATVLLAAGCAGPSPAAPAPAPAPVTSAPATSAPAVDGNAAACAGAPGTATTVRMIADTVNKGPVLPAAVALFLLDARQKAAAGGVTDPALQAAQQQMVAAIDDLDAQGKAKLPPGGNPASDTVALDMTKSLAATEAVRKACAALGR